MFRIRFHGRGGQGMKTASQILGSAFFVEGYEVQDAPRYGAERRGAPMFAFVRAARAPIQERGIITRPDLVIVADATLIAVAAAGVLQGVARRTVLLIHSAEPGSAWRERLQLEGPVLTLPALAQSAESFEPPYVGAACAGAAARMVGAIRRASLTQAIVDELGRFGELAVESNLAQALAAFDGMDAHAGIVAEGAPAAASGYEPPDWIDVPFEEARISAPDIQGGATSALSNTGVWRTFRPVIDLERCNRCSWICGTFCPDGAIEAGPDHAPRIDYDHCKGCLVCVAVCPPHAIRAVSEREAREEEVAT